MPFSSPSFKENIKDHLFKNIDSNEVILDVGPGAGTYGVMLSNVYFIDALEIYEPYVDRFSLRDIYNNVFIGDICQWNIKDYNYIILGDVLEHIPVIDAISLIDKINAYKMRCLVAVPYLYEQGEWEGNIYETHHQADLTPTEMKTRYPSLKLLVGDENYGYYVNY